MVCALQQYRSTEIPRLLAAVGFDYLFIDTEHGAFNLETVQDLVNASNHAGITPFVRVGEMLYSLATRALDIGAQGIIFPRVESAELLQEAVGWIRYPPYGKRGFGFMAPQLDYEQRSLPEIISHLNEQTMIIVQFETETSLDKCHELLAVPGIDVAMVGPADLSISLGVPGEFTHPKLVEPWRDSSWLASNMTSCRAFTAAPPSWPCRGSSEGCAFSAVEANME
jgi:2-dehydro-3-deoxyglucarate aldolase/4-hydroxy-2-oxoheptanedioate aldolase